MRILLISIIILLILFECVIASPKLEIDRPNKLDTVSQGIFYYTLKLSNIGTDTLKIKSISSSCGCTLAYKNTMVIPPNQSDTMGISVNLKLSKAHKEVSIIFESNDPINPKMNYVMTYFIRIDLKYIPKALPVFGNIKVGDEVTYKIKVINESSNSIEIQQPYINEKEEFEIITEHPIKHDLQSAQSYEFEIKLRVLSRKQIVTKLFIPSSSLNNPLQEYLLILN